MSYSSHPGAQADGFLWEFVPARIFETVFFGGGIHCLFLAGPLKTRTQECNLFVVGPRFLAGYPLFRSGV